MPNVTFRDEGAVKANPMTFVPENLDYSRMDYAHIMRKVLRYRDFSGYVPFMKWPKYPITAIFTCRGCTYNCKTCGGSHYAFKQHDGAEKGGIQVAGAARQGGKGGGEPPEGAHLHHRRSLSERAGVRRRGALPSEEGADKEQLRLRVLQAPDEGARAR